MAPEPRSIEALESIVRLIQLPHWQRFREEASKKLEKHESEVSRLVFKSRTPVDPIEIEYFRGFRQGVMYVLDGLPNEAAKELERKLKQMKESDA